MKHQVFVLACIERVPDDTLDAICTRKLSSGLL